MGSTGISAPVIIIFPAFYGAALFMASLFAIVNYLIIMLLPVLIYEITCRLLSRTSFKDIVKTGVVICSILVLMDVTLSLLTNMQAVTFSPNNLTYWFKYPLISLAILLAWKSSRKIKKLKHQLVIQSLLSSN